VDFAKIYYKKELATGYEKSQVLSFGFKVQ
jgi:hypothetical protein